MLHGKPHENLKSRDRQLENVCQSSILILGLPPCLSMAMYYRFNQSGCMSADTLMDKLININAPCQNKPANVIYQILAERFSQKEFDRITEFNFPNFVWDNGGANSAIVPDFLNKGPIASNGSLIKVS